MKTRKNTWENIIPLFSFLLLTGTAALITTSCEDEVVDRFVDIPGDTVTVNISGLNRIIAFQVEEFSADTVLEAAIKEDSLIIYWPSSIKPAPANISPTIVVSEGAIVTPASGENVPFETGTSFTVTAEDENEKTYFLKVVFYQPEPYYNSGSGAVRFFDRNDIHYIEVINGIEALGIYNDIRLDGDFFLTDTTKTQLVLTNLESDEQMVFPALSRTTVSIAFFRIPENFERGYYSSVFITGEKTIEEDSVWIKHPEPSISWPGSLTVEQGAEFTVTGSFFKDIEKAQFFTSPSDGKEKEALPEMPVVSLVDDLFSSSVTFKVPDDFPIGNYPENLTEVHVFTPSANSGKGKLIIPGKAFEVTAAPAGPK